MRTRIEEFLHYSAMPERPPIRWPGGARVAFWVAPNVEHYEFEPPPSPWRNAWPRVPQPDVMNYAYRDYANRVGFWRMLEVFDAHRLRATVSLNVAVLEHFPEVREAMVARDWEFMSHGIYNTRYLYGMSPDEEREFYRDTIETVHRLTGKRMKGMLGPAFTATANTPDLMAEAGMTYHVDWFVDDQPFPIRVGKGRLIGVPYSREINDALLFQNPAFDADEFVEVCKRQFDVLYEEGKDSGRVMCIALHPYLVGQPHRVKYLDEAFSYILQHDGVWATTADEIAEYYYEHYYERDLQSDREVSRHARQSS